MVAPTGAVLLKLSGEVAPGALHEQLAVAYDAWRQLQAQLQERVDRMQQQQEQESSDAAAGAAAAAAAAAAAQVEEEAGPSAEEVLAAALLQDVPLRLRFTDGTSMDATFSGSTLLGQVFQAADAARSALCGTGGSASGSGGAQTAAMPLLPYVLVSSGPPRRLLGAAEEGETLAALGVGPRSVLSAVPNGDKGHAPPAPPPPPQQPPPHVAAQQRQQEQGGEEVEEAWGPVDVQVRIPGVCRRSCPLTTPTNTHPPPLPRASRCG